MVGSVILLEIEGIWMIDEIKAKQKSRDRDIQGDRNTSYFLIRGRR